jgi:hypothetical protein
MLKEFNQSFGVATTLIAERSAFVNRASHMLRLVRERIGDRYDELYRAVCFELGIKPSDYMVPHYRHAATMPDPGSLAVGDFNKMLEVIMALRKSVRTNPPLAQFVDLSCQELLDRANLDLGITYKDGAFYPTGEPTLDHELIDHALTVLAPYPAEDKDLRLALQQYRAGKMDSVVDKCYRCVEGLLRQVLSNTKTLIDNKAELLRQLSLTDPWKRMLAAYIDFGNDYARHASAGRHSVSDAEVEGYLYTTCTLIRLILKLK